MKTIVQLLIFILIPTSLLSNKIDDLKTNSDVEDFLIKQNKRLKDFTLKTTDKLYEDSLLNKIADSLNVKSWQKVDFDNNGLTDLLVNGFWYGNSSVFVIIDNGQKFSFHSLSCMSSNQSGLLSIYN